MASSERQPLLSNPSAGGGLSSSTATASVPENSPENVNVNSVSKRTLILILAALWSAVFLGAMDGSSNFIFLSHG